MSSLLDLEKLLKESVEVVEVVEPAQVPLPTPEVTTIPKIPTALKIPRAAPPVPARLDTLAKSITDVTNIDFEGVFTEAVAIFAEQALMTKDAGDIDIKALQLSKAKADNFLAAIGGMTEISHKVELLAAEKYKFKRIDELNLLNSLRRQFEQATSFSAQTIDLCATRLNDLVERMGTNDMSSIQIEDLEKLGALQGSMENAINTLNTISLGAGKLIKTERESGGRSMGNTKNNTTNINTFLKTFETAKDTKGGPDGATAPRKLTEEELQVIMNNSNS